MPTGVLTSLYLSSPIAEVTLGPGLQVPQFTAAAPFAGGNIVLIDIIVDTLNMQTTGCVPYAASMHLLAFSISTACFSFQSR